MLVSRLSNSHKILCTVKLKNCVFRYIPSIWELYRILAYISDMGKGAALAVEKNHNE